MDLNTILKVGAVKIKSALDDTNKGSGFVYRPENVSDYLYLLTAKHCLVDLESNSSPMVEEIKVSFLNYDENECQSYLLNPETDSIIEFENEEDFAIIKILKTNLDERVLSKIHPIPIISSQIFARLREEEVNLNFYGFPNIMPDRGISGDAKIKDYGFANRFDIKLGDEAKYRDIQGWSGSGIICKIDGAFYLCGLLLSFRDGKSLPRLVGRDFDNINELLKSKDIPSVLLATIPEKVWAALSNREIKVRKQYLTYLKNDIDNRLNVSIHSARFIDLGIDDSPLATHLPWVYKDSNSTQEFDDINEAFDVYNGRILLLGEPGSGKTTTLLYLAQKLVNEALRHPDAPIPLIVNLSKLRLEASAGLSLPFLKKQQQGIGSDQKKVEQWLAYEFRRFPGIKKNLAQKWIKEGRIAAFLDGLDEVDDQYRAELVRLLNATYLRDHSDNITIVCSRINEYLTLQNRKETRLSLTGAITLQPLSPAQIENYLKDAASEELLESLPNDKALAEMARTPLTLSMMTLAYGASAPTDFDANLTFTERRHKLMEAYVNKMLQRKERRDQQIPFDEIKDNDISIDQYCYPPKKVNKYLGWLAVRMSVRMQTAFSFDSFYTFLINNINRDIHSAVWWSTAFSRGILLFLFLVIAAFIIGPITTDALLMKSGIGASAILCSIIGTWVALENEFESNKFEWIKMSLGGTFILGLIIILFGVSSVAIANILPVEISPFATGLLTICFLFAFMLFIIYDDDERSGITVTIVASLITLYFLSSKSITLFNLDSLSLAAVLILLYHVIYIGIIISEDEDDWRTVLVIMSALLFVVPGVIYLGVWWISPLDWYDAFILLFLSGILIVSIDKNPLLYLGLLVACFISGEYLADISGAILGITLFSYLFLILEILKEEDGKLEDAQEFLYDWVAKKSSRYFFSKPTLKILGFSNYQPIYLTRFYRYAEQALLLKQSAQDYEFMHRMLRDYFALRELQPDLHHPEVKTKLEAIRNLGFQGDAGIDALIEFSKQDNPEIRKAAVWAFGRIASPVVLPYIELAVEDRMPMVICEAIQSAKKQEHEQLDRLLKSVSDHQDLSVQKVWIEIALKETSFYRKFKEEAVQSLKKSPELVEFVFSSLLNKKSSTEQKSNIIGMASSLKTKDVINSLISFMKSDHSTYLRRRAMRALGDIKDPQAIPHLKKALKDRDEDIRETAAQVLSKIDPFRG